MRACFLVVFLLFYSTAGAKKFEEKAAIKSLQERQYVPVSFDVSAQEFEKIIDAFKQFLALPDDVKKKISHKLFQHHRRSDMGYVRRVNKKHGQDSKVFFHYHPVLLKKYQKLYHSNPRVKTFFDQADFLWHKAHDRLFKLLGDLKEGLPGARDAIFKTPHAVPVHLTLRFLLYDIPQGDSKLARSHFDAGCCTLALAESHPGLRIGKDEKSLHMLSHKEGQAIFFLAQNYKSLVGQKSSLIPGWHDVIQHPDYKKNPVKRWSIVAFFDAVDGTGGTLEDTHRLCC